MNLRTIMIFPSFENIEIISKIREKYDPLANLVKPHITIVFPFENQMSNEELSYILDKRLNGVKPFKIELQGFSKCEDKFGNYLFLDVIKGQDEIVKIHDSLYDNEFSSLDTGLKYLPHMTVGKVINVVALEKAYKEIKDIDCKFISMIDKISVEIIGDDEESIIVIEKKLA